MHNILQGRLDALLERDKIDHERRNPDAKSEDNEKLYADAIERYKVTSFIVKDDGIEYRSTNPDVYDDPRIGSDVNSIIIDTTSRSELLARSKIFPYVRIEIRLNDPSILNPAAILSVGSQNDSNFVIVGNDANWSEKTFSELQKLLNAKRNYRNLLYARFFYEIILYLLYIPTILLFALNYNEKLKLLENKYSIIVIYFAAFCVFYVSILIYRFAYDLFRISFPTVEIIEYSTKRIWLRWIASLFPVSMLFSAAYGIIKALT
jgi:hypothetical protein